MQFEVASHLKMTVARLTNEMSVEEFMRWVAFLRLEPREDRRLDANIGWLVLNMRRLVGDKHPKFKDSILQFKHDIEDSAVSDDKGRIHMMAEKMKAFVFSIKGGKGK